MPASPVLSSADETEQLRGKLLLRIEAAIFLDESDALEVERGDSRRLRRRDTPAHVDERALLAQARRQRVLLFRARSRSAPRRASRRSSRRSRFHWARRKRNRRRRCRRARGRGGRGCRRAWRRYPWSAPTGSRRAPEDPGVCAPADTAAAPEYTTAHSMKIAAPTRSRLRIVARQLSEVGSLT